MLDPNIFIMDGPIGLDGEATYTPSSPLPPKKKGLKEKLGDILASASSYPDPTAEAPSRGQRIAGGIGNMLGGVGAAMAQPSSENGAENFFRGLGAAQGHGQAQREDVRHREIEDFELGRQVQGDRRADDRLKVDSDHKANLERAGAETRRITEEKNAASKENDALKAYQQAIQKGTHEAIPDSLNDYLSGRAPAEFKVPEGFNRDRYEQVGSRFALRHEGPDEKTIAAMAAKDMRPRAGGGWEAVPEAELGAFRKSLIAKNNSAVDLNDTRKKYMGEMLRIRGQMAGIAMLNAHTAQDRLKLSRDQYNFNYKGQDENGNPVLQDPETGETVIPKIEAMNRVPASMQAKAAQAQTVMNVGDDLKKFVQELGAKGLIGPAAGRVAEGKSAIGLAQPEVKALMTELSNYAALQPQMHGMRGVKAKEEFDKAIGEIYQHPENIVASIEKIQAMAGDIKGDNTRVYRAKTGRGNPAATPRPVASPSPAAGQQRQTVKTSAGKDAYRMVDQQGNPKKVPVEVAEKMAAQGWKFRD